MPFDCALRYYIGVSRQSLIPFLVLWAALPLGNDQNKNREAIKRLKKEHDRHFVVWNFIDPDRRKFDTKDFDEQVLDVLNFPEYVPSLKFTFDLCNELRYWLKQDVQNVAVILFESETDVGEGGAYSLSLCLRSRVCFAVSAFLANSGFTKTAQEGADLFLERLGHLVEPFDNVPSQHLYYKYVDDARQQGLSNTEPLTLDCVFVHTIPLLDRSSQCRPVLEITCGGRPLKVNEPKQTFSAHDEIMVFDGLALPLWADVVISCYHVLGNVKKAVREIEGKEGGNKAPLRPERHIIFRICFHVGFLQSGGQMQRLRKADLDFASCNPSISPDFCVDLIFSKDAVPGGPARPGLTPAEEAELENSYIFPSDFTGLTDMSQRHVVQPRRPVFLCVCPCAPGCSPLT